MESLDEKIQRANELLKLIHQLEKLENDYDDARQKGEVSTLEVASENFNVDLRGYVIDLTEECIRITEEIAIQVHRERKNKEEMKSAMETHKQILANNGRS
jgi:hypothetical protein